MFVIFAVGWECEVMEKARLPRLPKTLAYTPASLCIDTDYAQGVHAEMNAISYVTWMGWFG